MEGYASSSESRSTIRRSMRVLLTALIVGVMPPAFAGDDCESQLPASLRRAAEKAYSAYRTPVVADNLADDVEYRFQETGNRCLGVAKADFDGDGAIDYLIAMSARKSSGAKVLVALARGKEWALRSLAFWPEGRSRLYVGSEKPGKYERTLALEGPLGGAGEREALDCRNPVAVFGGTEASGVAYCYMEGTCPHVWISD